MFPKKEQKVIKSKCRKQVSLYREASSDDEFARQHLIFPSSDSEGGKGRGKKGKKRTKKTKPSNVEEDLIENSSDSGNDDDMNYRIQHILGRMSLSAKDWRKITDSMTTREITKGSAWQQPDDEYYDTSDSPVEKFLIKWAHASYVHVSWETEKDLVDNVGKAVKLQIKKFLQRESEGTELFDDLAKGEYFPASFVTIDRILDVDDKAVNIHKVDWKIASLPDISKKDGYVEEKKDDGEDVRESKASEAADLEEQRVKGEEEVDSGDGDDASHLDDFDDLYFGDEDDEKSAVESDDDVVEVVEEVSNVTTELGRGRRARGKKNYNEDDSEEQWWTKKSKKSKGDQKEDNKTAQKKSSAKKIIRFDPLLLHRDECYLTIKWEGLPYSEVSFESVQDIFRASIEYESPLRAFYAREQKDGVDMTKDVETGKRKLKLGEDVIGPNSIPPPFKGGILRDYQWEGVRWMLYNMGQQRNCILADEMGLGKTIQSAALIQMLKHVSQPTAGPFLIIAPLSLIVNWQREIAMWTDCDSILYYGSQDDRELIRTFEFSFLDYGKRGGSVKSGAGGKSKKAGCKIEVVITTPETCVALDTTTATGRGKRELSNIHWDLVIVDEAHKLKNYDSKLGITLREEYVYNHCLLLTGTPLQNNTDELWTLLNFVDRDRFADREGFYSKYGELKTSSQLDELYTTIRPYLLRREKDIVEKNIPPKEEVIIEVELTVPQKQYYRAIYEQKTHFLYKQGSKDGPNLTNLAMELRKVCNHPFLIKGAVTELCKWYDNMGGEGAAGVGGGSGGTVGVGAGRLGAGIYDAASMKDMLVKTSGKMTLLDKLLPKLHADKHRVLIFSQFRIMLDILEDYLHYGGYTYERVDGSVTGKKRQAAIDRYTNNDQVFVMLLSTRAGGVGINLTAADTVIIFDSDWNPQNDVQAQARAHRIGQTRPVTVYRLLTRKSYEMVMFKAASLKLGLDYAIMHNLKNGSTVQGVGSEDVAEGVGKKGKKGKKGVDESALQGISTARAETASALSKRELENLLKHGAYDIFLEEKTGQEEEASKVFVEESIESILQRSSMFKHTSDNPNVECTKLGSNFAKASFISAGQTDGDVAIDDPDFWTKVVGIGMDNGDGNDGDRTSKRKRAVETYREPSDSIRSIYGDLASAYRTDSDSDSDSDKKAGVKRKRRDMDEDVPAVYSAENMTALCNVLYTYGYGAWQQLRIHSKLRWALDDMIKGSLICSAYTIMLACVSLDKTQTEVYGSLAALSKRVDYGAFEALVKKNKLCKLVLFMTMHVVNQSEDNQTVVYSDIHAAAWNKVVHALKSCLSNRETTMAVLVDAFTSSLSDDLLTFQSPQPEASAGNETEQPYYVALQALVSYVSEIPGVQDMTKPLVEEADVSKLIKKLHVYKVRLQELEDLFEAQLLHSAMSEMMEEDPRVDIGEVEGSSEVKSDNPEETNVGYRQLFSNLCKLVDQDVVLLNHPHAGTPSTLNAQGEQVWCSTFDVRLLQAVGSFGWPDGRKRLRHIQSHLIATIPTVFVPLEGPADESIDVNMDKPDAKVENSTDANTATDKPGTVLGEGVESSNEVTVPIAKKEVVYTNNEYLSSKFLSARLRSLAKLFRYASEDIRAIQKAEQVVKLTEANARNRKVQNILKCIQRVGCVRSVYEQLQRKFDENCEKNLSYLLTWEKFLAECGYEVSSQNLLEVKGICSALVNLFLKATDGQTEEQVHASSDAYADYVKDLESKQLTAAFDHVDTIHRVRMMLVLYTQADITEIINRECKVMDLSVPIFRRDMSLPYWWNTEFDYTLLCMICEYGCSQWKKLTSDARLKGPEKDVMVLPPKVNGLEWVTVLTPKILEKRLNSLLRPLPTLCNLHQTLTQTLQFPVPSSPMSMRTRDGVSASSGGSSGKAGIAGMFKRMSSAPPVSKKASIAMSVINIEEQTEPDVIDVASKDTSPDLPLEISDKKVADVVFDAQTSAVMPTVSSIAEVEEGDNNGANNEVTVPVVAVLTPSSTQAPTPARSASGGIASMFAKMSTPKPAPAPSSQPTKDTTIYASPSADTPLPQVEALLPTTNAVVSPMEISDEKKADNNDNTTSAVVIDMTEDNEEPVNLAVVTPMNKKREASGDVSDEKAAKKPRKPRSEGKTEAAKIKAKAKSKKSEENIEDKEGNNAEDVAADDAKKGNEKDEDVAKVEVKADAQEDGKHEMKAKSKQEGPTKGKSNMVTPAKPRVTMDMFLVKAKTL